MGVTNLSKDDLEVMLQLFDSLVDVLQKENEIGKMVSEQEDNHDKTEKQFSNLDKQFEELNNPDNMTLASVMECRDIIVKAIKGKDEFSELIRQSGILYSEYHTVTDERLKLRKEIDELLKKGQVIENKKCNQGINVSSLKMIVHIINPTASEFIKEPVSDNSKISVSTYNVVNDIARTYSNYEEESEVVLNNYEKLIALYNRRNRTKEEDEAFLNKLPKFCKKDADIISKEEPVLEENTNQTENIIEPSSIVTTVNDNVLPNNEGIDPIILDIDKKVDLEKNVEPSKIGKDNEEINIDSLKLDEETPNLDVVIESLTHEKNNDDLQDIVYVNVPANPTKIANSSKQKQEVILNVWKKYDIKKTIFKQSEKKKNVTTDNIVPLDAILSDKNKDKKDNISDIQAFLSNAA